MELVFALLLEPILVKWVHYKYYGIGEISVVLVVQFLYFFVAAEIPHDERDVLVLYLLDVESECGNGSNIFTHFKLVGDGRLASSIQANKYQFCFNICMEKQIPYFVYFITHF